MNKILLTLVLLVGFSFNIIAQQDAMFTQYMFNPMFFNPAVAGTKEVLDVSVMHRHQWVGIKGAPFTQTISAHSPIRIGEKNENASFGGMLHHDQIGISRSVGANLYFSYKLQLNSPRNAKKRIFLNIGLSGGASFMMNDFSLLELYDTGDPTFQSTNERMILPNFGTGLYLHSENWYFGFSVPRLWTNSLRDRLPSSASTVPVAQEFRHYYATAGGVIKLTESLSFRPSILIKNVGLFFEESQVGKIGAPTQFDMNLGFILIDKIWFGASYRTALEALTTQTSSFDSIDFWAGIRLDNGFRVGIAYDFTLTGLRSPGQATYELMLGYDLYDKSGGPIIDPRHLNF
jgi:type IX secretion system PorP/SprF family membrane protein